jgi:hypothetical protein
MARVQQAKGQQEPKLHLATQQPSRLMDGDEPGGRRSIGKTLDELNRRNQRSFATWAKSHIVDAVEALRMSEEKGGSMVIFLVLFGIFAWLMFADPKPSQIEPIKSDRLIDEAASVLDDCEPDPRLEDTQPMPTIEAAKQPEILVFVAPEGQKCEPCDRWKRCEMQRFMDAHWKVGIVEVHPFPRTPTFHLITDGGLVEHAGYLTLEQAKGLLK